MFWVPGTEVLKSLEFPDRSVFCYSQQALLNTLEFILMRWLRMRPLEIALWGLLTQKTNYSWGWEFSAPPPNHWGREVLETVIKTREQWNLENAAVGKLVEALGGQWAPRGHRSSPHAFPCVSPPFGSSRVVSSIIKSLKAEYFPEFWVISSEL